MKYFHFYTRQRNKDATRELDITIQAWGIKDAYDIWNKMMARHQKEGWHVIGNYCGRNS